MEIRGGNVNSDSRGQEWGVYKDAFIPQPPARVSKAWDRTPVLAHAPRLQGQKIWKKVGTSLRSQPKNENVEDAQVELGKEGMGPRKRARIANGKENVRDATWKAHSAENDDEFDQCATVESPRKKRVSTVGGLGNSDALLVPRKRTNTDHLITPRKPARKSVLVEVAGKENTIIKSLPLNDTVEKVNNSRAGEEKPTRRRKSLRKSIRLSRGIAESQTGLDGAEPATDLSDSQLTTKPISEAQPTPDNSPLPIKPGRVAEAIAYTLGTPSMHRFRGANATRLASPTKNKSKTGDQTDMTSTPDKSGVEGESSETSTRSANLQNDLDSSSLVEQHSNIGLNPNSTAKKQEKIITKEAPLTPQDTSTAQFSEMTEYPQVHGEILTPTSLQTELLVSSSDGDAKDPSSSSEDGEILEQPSEKSNSEPLSPTYMKQPIAHIDEQAIKTPKKLTKAQHATPASVNVQIKGDSSIPVKVAETPKSKKRTPQRSGTRRSARNTRGSSEQLEEHVTHQSVSEISNAELLATPHRKSRSIEGSKSENNIEQPMQHGDTGTSPHKSSAQVDAVKDTQKSQLIVSQTVPTGFLTPMEALADQELQHMIDDGVDNTEASYLHSPKATNPLALEGAEVQKDENTSTVADFTETEAKAEAAPEVINTGQTRYITMADDSLSGDQLPSHSSVGNLLLPLSPVPQSNQKEKVGSVEALEDLEPISVSISHLHHTVELVINEPVEDVPGTSTPDAATTELVEAISENATNTNYDEDDTDMLRNFLSRVKANKAAKATTSIPKRKRSLPHSPLRLPLESTAANLEADSRDDVDEFDVSVPVKSPNKRRKGNDGIIQIDDDATEPKSIRRSGRTRLPVKAAPLGAPSFIPVRRIGQDGDSTITLRRNEEKELAALTKVNTRKNKGAALHPVDLLAKKSDEKEDPASRQRALKEVFDEKILRQKKSKKEKTVVWAEEIAQFQTLEGKRVEVEKEPEKGNGKGKSKEKTLPLPVEDKKVATVEEKGVVKDNTAVKVGMRSKMTLGMAANGTPAPKRRKGRL